MLIGETFSGASGDEYYTPWMPRQGNGVTTTFEVMAIATDAKVTVALMHKNSEDTGDGTALSKDSGTDNLTAAGIASFRNKGIKELVRYRLTLGNNGSPTEHWAHYRILTPAWETSGAQSI